MKFPLRIAAFVLPLLAMTMNMAPVAMAVESAERESRVHPWNCEAWLARIDELLVADESLENEIGRLYAEPGLQFCITRQVRVSSDRERRDWDFFEVPDWSFLAWMLRTLAIVALLSLCLWLIWRWRAFASGIIRGRQAPRSASAAPERAHLDEPADLPHDIPAAAQAAWQENRPRLAMSLLYRGAARALLPDLDTQQSRTERELLNTLKSRKTSVAVLSYMNRLINHWLRMAWADQPPSQKDFDLLCKQWARHCRATTGPTVKAQPS